MRIRNSEGVDRITESQTLLQVPIRNIPLAIFYVALIAILWLFVNYLERQFNQLITNEGKLVVAITLTIVLLYFIAKSIWGKAVVRLEDGIIHLHEGVFGIGNSKTLHQAQLNDIYIYRTQSGGGTSAGRPIPVEIDQHIIFETDQKIKFLHNQIPMFRLKEVCNTLRKELLE